jgi:pyruvate dehydrogenase E2 component (dihydrolipoamide acetyltransferase)
MTERVFVLPDLGEGLEEATVTAWLVAEGEEVALNQPIAEIETAKAVVEIPSPYAGRIAGLHAEAGSTIAVGAPLATFEVAAPSVVTDDEATQGPAPVVAATPAVRRLAKDLGVDLAEVRGSGPGGRVTSDDLERAAGGVPAATADAAGDADEILLTPVRRAIAQNLSAAAQIPQVTTFRQVDCTALDARRRELGVSPLPVVVRALAETCLGHPMLNASWAGDRILRHREVHVGVATDTEAGLLVPVVRGAGRLGIGEIAAEIERLARRARERSLGPGDTAGATIAVSNTGSYGSQSGTPLLNPGHAVTIALGLIEPRALVVEGRVEARLACTLSLTFDHRVLDGATVGRGLGALVELLESAERLGALPR